MRDTFIIYRSYYEAIKELPKEDQADIWGAICEYTLNGNEPELTGVCSTIFTLIRPLLDKSRQNYMNGKKGGRKPNEPKPKRNRTKTEKEPKRNRTESESKGYKNKDKDKNVDKDKDVDKNVDKDIRDHSEKNSLTLHKSIKKLFMEYSERETGLEYYWTARDAGQVKNLVNRIKNSIKSKEKNSGKKEREIEDSEIVNGFEFILNSLDRIDKFYKKGLTFSKIVSQYNAIIAEIKSNGKAGGGDLAKAVAEYHRQHSEVN